MFQVKHVNEFSFKSSLLFFKPGPDLLPLPQSYNSRSHKRQWTLTLYSFPVTDHKTNVLTNRLVLLHTARRASMEGNAKGSFSQRRQEAIEISLQPSQWLYTWVIFMLSVFYWRGEKERGGNRQEGAEEERWEIKSGKLPYITFNITKICKAAACLQLLAVSLILYHFW